MKVIKIYEWSDLKKWFWDQFCFPRRKLVAEWLDYHNKNLRSLFEEKLVTYGNLDITKEEDLDKLSAAVRSWCDAVKKESERTEELIMMK